jgi:hypothetical protein
MNTSSLHTLFKACKAQLSAQHTPFDDTLVVESTDDLHRFWRDVAQRAPQAFDSRLCLGLLDRLDTSELLYLHNPSLLQPFIPNESQAKTIENATAWLARFDFFDGVLPAGNGWVTQSEDSPLELFMEHVHWVAMALDYPANTFMFSHRYLRECADDTLACLVIHENLHCIHARRVGSFPDSRWARMPLSLHTMEGCVDLIADYSAAHSSGEFSSQRFTAMLMRGYSLEVRALLRHLNQDKWYSNIDETVAKANLLAENVQRSAQGDDGDAATVELLNEASGLRQDRAYWQSVICQSH